MLRRAVAVPRQHSLVRRSSLRLVTLAGVADAPFCVLTGGTFASLFALALGATPLAVGLLTALPALGAFVPLAAAPWLDRMSKRRAAVACLGLARLLWVAPLALLLAPASWPRPWLFLAAASASAFAGAAGGLAWLSWVGGLVPARVRGRYFGRRGIATGLAAVAVSAAAGPLLDGRFAGLLAGTKGLLLVFGLAVGLGLAGVAALSRVEAPRTPGTPRRVSLRQALGAAAGGAVGRYAAFSLVWHAALNIGGPFITVFQVEQLGMSATTIGSLVTLTAAATLMTGAVWGRVADARGDLRVMLVTGAVAATLPAFWLAAGQVPLVPSAALWHALSGVAWSGFNLAAGNLSLALVPRERSAVPLALLSAASGTGAAIGPVIGGVLLDLLARHPTWDLGLGAYGAVFLLSTVCRLGAVGLLLGVQEPGRRPAYARSSPFRWSFGGTGRSPTASRSFTSRSVRLIASRASSWSSSTRRSARWFARSTS